MLFMIENDPLIMAYIEFLKSQGCKPWVGFDLDGTLAELTPHFGTGWPKIGKPIIETVRLIKHYQKHGLEVKVFTARASRSPEEIEEIHIWLKNNNLPDMEVTNIKDPWCVAIFDDIAYRVKRNTGEIL